MRNGFLRGTARQLAAVSVAIVAVISAAIWCTIWRYESAGTSSSVALNAVSVSGDTYALEIHFQDEKDAATRYVLVPSPAFRQANAADQVDTAIQQISVAADSLAAEQTQRAATADRLEELVAEIEQGLQAAPDSVAAPTQTAAASRLPGYATPHLSRVDPVQV